MLHNENVRIHNHIKDGMTGIELETHRIDKNGHLSQTAHPFPGNSFIDRDFSESQIEINTPPYERAEEALSFLHEQLKLVHKSLREDEELLWPFSNPPIIDGEDDIPIARYDGDLLPSYNYRVYLSERYGKYKMTYSGIHFNYSFSETLLRENYELERVSVKSSADAAFGSKFSSYEEYRDNFYLKLAEKALSYSWVCVALLAASPLVDNSFYESGKSGTSIFNGFASLRCSDYGYWNPFIPILNYESVDGYVSSIERYIDRGWLIQPRELYYPVRIKPPGKYTLQSLRDKGVNHIELRMVDLNPFCDDGIDLRDLEFLKLFLIWLASFDMLPLSEQDQLQALQNYKASADYDWNLARISMPGKKADTLHSYLSDLLLDMNSFYADDPEAADAIAYQKQKLSDESIRYASKVRAQFGSDYIGLGLAQAKKLQSDFQ